MSIGRIGAVLVLLPVATVLWADEAADFETSLHATRAGKAWWYDADNGGFEKQTGIPMEKLGCQECHGPADADGNPYPEEFPGGRCVDCHRSEGGTVAEEQCLKCHGRQAMESVRMKIPDVHREAGMKCWDCHGSEDLHGDGTAYTSMFQTGAMKTDCGDCHAVADLGEGHRRYDPHDGALHCSACHAKTVIACYNCHFESQVKAHVKRARKPLQGFVLLVNREKDGKVHPASFQSVTYEGKAFVAFGPYSPHTITAEGRECKACHAGAPFKGDVAAIAQYNESGTIRFVTVDAETGALDWVRGVVPIPEDYEKTLRMDFLTFDGDPATPAGKGSEHWRPIGKDSWDGHQMFFARPLTREQMDRLGFRSSENPD